MRAFPLALRAARFTPIFLAATLCVSALFLSSVQPALAGLYPPPPAYVPPWDHPEIYIPKTAGGVIHYRFTAPWSYDANNGQLYPVVIYVHGNGEVADNFIANDPYQYNWEQLQDAGQYAFLANVNQAVFPCFLVQVARRTAGAMPSDQQNAVINIPNDLIALGYHIDLNRVIVTGSSGGGGDTLRLATTGVNKFAAIVPICPVSGGTMSTIKNKPIWFFHAKDDGTVGWDNSADRVIQLRGLGGEPIYTQYDTGNHFIWTIAFETPALIPWLAAQRLGQPPQKNPVFPNRLLPTQNSNFVSGATSTSLMGVIKTNGTGLADPAVSKVTYRKGTYAKETVLSTATGTTEWSTPAITVDASGTTRIDVVVEGTSWGGGWAGKTFYSSTLFATRSITNDTTLPVVQITAPTVNASYTTPVTSINVAGTAADANLTSVIWRNNRGGVGAASGTAAWWANNIALKTGVNVITIEARDSAGNVGIGTLNVTCLEGPPPPGQWAHTDISSPATPGGMVANPDGSITISGAGVGGMFGNNGECHFTYVEAFGDCMITAKMESQATNVWNSLSGLLIQPAFADGNPYVTCVSEWSRGGNLMCHRAGEGWGETSDWMATAKAPCWLRLKRVGNTFTGYHSATGVEGTWTLIGTNTIPMGASTYMGMFVASQVADTAGQATFSNVTVDGSALPVTGYAAWAAAKGIVGSLVQPNLDPNNNGQENLIEYAVEPPANQPPTTVGVFHLNGSDYLSLEFDRPATAHDLTYTVQVSSDPSFSNTADVGTSSQAGNTGAGFVSSSGTGETRHLVFRDTVPMGGEARFIRLKVDMQ